MGYVLRDYQVQASDAAVRFFSNTKSDRNGILVAPYVGAWIETLRRWRMRAVSFGITRRLQAARLTIRDDLRLRLATLRRRTVMGRSTRVVG